jgi:hypothetical protein
MIEKHSNTNGIKTDHQRQLYQILIIKYHEMTKMILYLVDIVLIFPTYLRSLKLEFE